jgi:hypothetical protein
LLLLLLLLLLVARPNAATATDVPIWQSSKANSLKNDTRSLEWHTKTRLLWEPRLSFDHVIGGETPLQAAAPSPPAFAYSIDVMLPFTWTLHYRDSFRLLQ